MPARSSTHALIGTFVIALACIACAGNASAQLLMRAGLLGAADPATPAPVAPSSTQAPGAPAATAASAATAGTAAAPPRTAADASASTPPTPTAPTTTPPVVPDASIPMAEIAPRADAVMSTLRAIEQDLGDLDALATMRADTRLLGEDSARMVLRTEQVLRANPSLELLRELESAWAEIDRRSSANVRDQTRRLGQVERHLQELDRLSRQWMRTLQAARDEGAPAEVTVRAERLLGQINDMRSRATHWRMEVLSLQSRAGDIVNTASEMRAGVQRSQQNAFGRLFTVDSEPLWRSTSVLWNGQNLLMRSRESIGSRWKELSAWASMRSSVFALLVLGFVLLSALVFRLRATLREQQQSDPQIVGAAIAVERPFAIAALLTLLLANWMLPAAPGLFNVIVLTVAAVPTALVIGQTVARSLLPVVYALIGLFLIDQLRGLTDGSQAQAAVGFLMECLLIMAVASWLVRKDKYLPLVSALHRVRAQRLVDFGERAGAAIAALGATLYIFGLSQLADLTIRAFLILSYSAVVLYATSRIAKGILATVLRTWPFTLSSTVRNHREALVQRGNRLMKLLLMAAWVWIALDASSLRRPVWTLVQEALALEAGSGTWRISLGGVVAFVVTLLAAYVCSRSIKLVLQEEVYPRVEMPRGVPYAITSIIHYCLMFIGTLAAVSSMGIDLTRFTVLSGAFGVGLGLGLQGVVNNFVSGLFLLFERPLKIGDMVQLDDLHGRVDRIGIRATVLRLGNGAEVIVPNGKLISERLTNWTFSSRLRRMDLSVSAGMSTDAEQVRVLLLECAAKTGGVVARPEPQALLMKLGPDMLEFSLQAWTEEAQRWPRVQSNLLLEINSRMRAEGIPFK